MTAAAGAPCASVAVLDATRLTKHFPGTLALDEVDLSVGRNEIHALLGGNGSGKSTLIKILAGVTRADAGGRIRIGDTSAAVESWSPRAARAAGIRVVHQDPGVFGDLSVADNMAAGHGYLTGPGFRIRRRDWHRHTAQVLERLQIDASPTTLVSRLRPATQTMIAIGRALQDVEDHTTALLVLDEPTAALPRGEVDLLFAALRRYAAAGQAILFVSHRLPEVLSLCQQVTVLRDGVKVATTPTAGLDELDLGELVVGRRLTKVVHRRERKPAERPPVALQARALTYGPLRDLELDLRRGEVLGVAGLLGSGRTTLLRLLFGDLHPERGEVTLPGRSLDLRRPGAAIESGIALVPEDRGRDAVFGSLTLDSNLAAVVLRRYWRGGVLRARRQRRESQGVLREFKVKAADVGQSPTMLSGGNQQKMVLARWLRTRPEVLLLDNPTQGVDVGAREDIHLLVRAAADEGTAVLVVSDDFDELARLCDGVVVLRQGRLTAHVTGSELTADRIGREVYGARRDG